MAKVNAKQIIKSSATLIAALFLISTPALASENKDNAALRRAQEFEMEGKYAVAASAYLALAEGFDFVPENKKAVAFKRGEQVLLAKCAINCLEEGIRQQLSNSGSLDNCPELMMLPAACNTLMRLDPQNSGRDTMTIIRNLKTRSISSSQLH